MENKIRIAKVGITDTDFRFYTKNSFFSSPIIIDIEELKVVITHTTLADLKFSEPSKSGQTYSAQIKSYDLTEGEYLIDEEESNEDQLIIYFEDKIENEESEVKNVNKHN